MTTLEKGKFIKNFVRINKNGRLIKFPHSNRIGYSKADVTYVEPLIDSSYWANWERFLEDRRKDIDEVNKYGDWQHYLFSLNSISQSDIDKYKLPNDFLVIKEAAS